MAPGGGLPISFLLLNSSSSFESSSSGSCSSCSLGSCSLGSYLLGSCSFLGSCSLGLCSSWLSLAENYSSIVSTAVLWSVFGAGGIVGVPRSACSVLCCVIVKRREEEGCS